MVRGAWRLEEEECRDLVSAGGHSGGGGDDEAVVGFPFAGVRDVFLIVLDDMTGIAEIIDAGVAVEGIRGGAEFGHADPLAGGLLETREDEVVLSGVGHGG